MLEWKNMKDIIPKDVRMLNVIDEKDNIIRKATREEIHKKGLLHREIHVWFYTAKREIIFQHRAKDKDTFPDLLDATVGGHIEMEQDYEDAAIKEVEEETGIKVDIKDLHFIQTIRSEAHDPVTKMTNNVIRAIYAYRYEGKFENLKVEEEEALGFEAWPIAKLLHISEEDRKYFIPAVFRKEMLEIFDKISKLA